MRRGLCVELVERPTWAVTSRAHAEKEDPAAARKDGRDLPGFLIGLVEIEVAQSAPIRKDKSGLASGREDKPSGPRVFTTSRRGE